MTTKNTPRVQKQGGNVVSYFCSPRGQVLDFVVGPVAANRLKASAELAQELHNKIKRLPFDQKRSTARSHHQRIADKDALDRFQKFNPDPRWTGDTPPDGYTKGDAEQVARAVFFTASKFPCLDCGMPDYPDVFPASFRTFDLQRADAIRAHHKNKTLDTSLRNDYSKDRLFFMEHTLLAELPLIELSKIEKPVFQILVGQRFQTKTKQYAAKLKSFQEAQASGNCVLAILTDKPKSQQRISEGRDFLPPNLRKLESFNAIRNQLSQFEVITVTNDELFGLLSDSGHKPIDRNFKNKSIVKKGIGYVLFDQTGNVAKLLPSGVRPTSVSTAMKNLTKN